MRKRMVPSLSISLIALILITGIAYAAPHAKPGECSQAFSFSFRSFFNRQDPLIRMDGCQSETRPAPKVDICHFLGNGEYIKINISANALQAHLDHGDAHPNDYVPGMSDWALDENCVQYELMSEVLFVESYKAPEDPTPQVSTTSFSTKPGTSYQLV
nr:hypothetical protein [Gammaproteobacteria bacterium]